MIKSYKGDIILILSAMVYGSGLVAQSVGNALGPWTFSAVRFLLGAAVLFPVALITYKKHPPETEEDDREMTVKEMIPGAIAIGVTLLVMVLTQQYGLLYTSVGKSGFITSTYVIGVPLSGVIFLKRKISRRIWLAALISVAGFYFISLSGGVEALNKGDLLTLITALTSVIYVHVINNISKKANPYMFSCLQFFVTGILFLIGALIFETSTPEMFLDNLPSILYAGIGTCATGYTLQMLGQKYVSPERASILLGTEALFSLFSGMIILNEMLSFREYLGCGLIFFAVMLAESGGQKETE